MFSQVVSRIVKEQQLDEKTVITIFKLLFPEPTYTLKARQLKAIADQAFSALRIMFDKEKRNPFEDDKVLYIIMISQNYQEHDLIIELRRKLSDFIQKLKDQSVTLKEANDTIIQKRKNLRTIIKLIDPSFNINILVRTEEIYQRFFLQIEKFENYLAKAQKSDINVSTKNFQQKLSSITFSKDNLMISKAESLEHFEQFKSFQTVDLFYLFRDSKVFDNLFGTLGQEVKDNNVHFEEYKDPATGEYQVKIENYDKACLEYLFGKKMSEHFKCLLGYPKKQICQFEISKVWSNIRPDQVDAELTLISSYLQNHQLKQSKYTIQYECFQNNLARDLKNFTRQDQFRARSEIINNLTCYQKKSSTGQVQLSPALDRMAQFLEQMKSNNPTERLDQISERVSKLTEDFAKMDQNYKIQWDLLEEYVRSQETYEFCIQESGFSFNSLYELDDSASMNNRTIESINSVSVFFVDLYSQIQALPTNDYEKVLNLLSQKLNEQIQREHDFQSKLAICNTNLQEIKRMTRSSRNDAENTLQVIENALRYGVFIFYQQRKKFHFALEINTPVLQSQTIDKQEASDKKNGAQRGSNTERKLNRMQEDKILQHSVRAKLFIHSKKSSVQRQLEVIEIDKIFTESVDLCKLIHEHLQELKNYGHLDFQKNVDYYEFLRVPISRGSIVEILKHHYQNFRETYEELREQLQTQRSQFYFLNYVPNYLVAHLNSGSIIEEQFREILLKLEQIKVFKKPVTRSIFSRNKIELLQSLQMIWDEQNLIESPGQQANLNQQQLRDMGFQLINGSPQYKVVPDNLSLIKAICSIFAISKLNPQYDRVLLCEEDTQMIEIQAFINRSLLFPDQAKSNKPFVIANFQKLPFQIQHQTYLYIQQMKIEPPENYNPAYTLYILSIQMANQTSRLIEILRNSHSFNQYLRDDSLREYLRKNYETIEIVKSVQCGLGKTEYIQAKVAKDRDAQILRIPIHGSLSKKKFIDIIENNYSRLPKPAKRLYIHYDVYPCGKEDLNVILFELLILKCLNYQFQEIFHIPQNQKIFVEISHSLNEQLSSLFINNNFIEKQRIWDFMSINVKENVNDKFNKVCRYLDGTDEAKRKLYDPKALKTPKAPLGSQDCYIMLRMRFSKLLRNPNFYYVNSFVDFVNDQISRMEESPFFEQENLERQMTGFFNISKRAKKFHHQVMSQLLELSQRISIVEKFSDSQEISQNLERRAVEEEQANRFREIEWDVYKHPFIVFNDGGDITAIFKDVTSVPEAYVEYHRMIHRRDKDNQQLKPYSEYTQTQFIEKILNVCVADARKERIRKMKELKSLVFTLDNFMKLVLIYLRIRNFQPILLMGETGVGKTSLVQYLCFLIDAEFMVLNVHAGISEQDINKFVKEAQSIARSQKGDNLRKRRKVIVFFDEINTNENINGLLKEVFIDRHINGQKLEPNICMVAACNPFKLRPTEVSGLSSGLRMNDRDQTMSRLVYRVIPLPESFIPYIWDYKSLNQSEEEKYIRKMIEKTFDEAKIYGRDLQLVKLWLGDRQTQQSQVLIVKKFQEEIMNISKAVFIAQSLIKKRENTTWAVSLRDVSRFCKLYQYFILNNSNQDITQNQRRNQQGFSSRHIALVLSIYFCYVVRISEQSKRKSFLQDLYRNITENQIRMDCLRLENFTMIVNNEQNRFISQMEIKRGIGLSQTLKENIFVIITCILTNIPLIITGKPGSSKTLSMNLITQSFKGQLSSKPFFRYFPEIKPLFFQGSEQTTSKSIEMLFKKAIKTQANLRARGSDSKVVVVFDEIGLAEQSQHNPLKILHSLLEPPQVAFLGISNWSLDASKMNRVVTLSRYDPDKNDLYQTAESIAQNFNPNFPVRILNPLTDWYLELMDKQRRSEQTRDFHGLRDFYSLIKYIAPKIGSSEENNNKFIVKGVLRNFGGLKNSEAITLLEEKLGIDSDQINKPDQLIIENMKDQDSRHLMIITDNAENTLEFIQDQCQKNQKNFEIFYGSDFPDDQNEDATYEQITEIIFHMEHGSLVVFLNLKNVYQSFYDMLNQNYTEIGTQNTQKYSKVAVGADQSLFLVHQNFKCILIVGQDQIQDLDGPLKNRFEKQLYTEDISTHLTHKQLKADLSQWTYSISKFQKFERKQMFPTLDEHQSFQQLINQTKDIYHDLTDESIKIECKRALIRLANFQGILRCQYANAYDKEFWYQEYFKTDNHFDLYSLLEYYSKCWRDERCFDNQDGFNLVVYTYAGIIETDRLHSTYKMEEILDLSHIHKKKQYTQRIEQYFSKSNENELIIIYADMSSTITKNMINLCRSKINSLRTHNNAVGERVKHVIFVIRLDFNSKSSDHSISMGKIWRQYMIDILNGQGHYEITIKQLFDKNIEELISEASTKQSIFEQALVESLSKIFYKKAQSFITERLAKIKEIFSIPENNSFLTELIISKFKKNPKYEQKLNSWRVEIVCSDYMMKSNMTFHGAAIESIKQELVNHLAFVISHLEQDGIITSYENKELFEMAKDYFKILYNKNIVNNRFFNYYYLNYNFDKIKFPLARVLHQQFQQLKVQFMKNDKRLTSSKLKYASSSFKNNLVREQLQLEGAFDNTGNMSSSNLLTQSSLDDEMNFNSTSNSQLLRFQSQRQRENEREIILTTRKILQRDKYLSKNIKNLISWCDLYFPKEYINENMLTENNMQYLEDFAYLNNSSEAKSTDSSANEFYKSYMKNMISLFLKERLNQNQKLSKAEIYGIYWKHENLLHNVWKLISENVSQKQLKSYEHCESLLIQKVKENHLYRNRDLQYLPREAFMQSVIKVFFQLYYPTEGSQNHSQIWEENLKQTFQRLNDLSFYYQGVTYTNESRIMMVLLKYNDQVSRQQAKVKNSNSDYLEFAQKIKDLFEMQDGESQSQQRGSKAAQQFIILLLDEMEKNWGKFKDRQAKQTIFKIACEYLIESFELEENIDFQFLLNEIIAYMIKKDTDQYAINCLQQDETFKFVLKNLVSIMMTLINQQNYGSKVQTCFQVLIESEHSSYNNILPRYPLIKIMNDFLERYQEGLSMNDPILISFTDQLIDFIKYDPFEHLDRIQNALIHIKQHLFASKPEVVSLQLLIAITTFKKIAIIFISEIDFHYKDEDTCAVELDQLMREFFQCDNQQQRDRLKPLVIYTAKLLYQKFDFLKTDRSNLSQFTTWIDENAQKLDDNPTKFSFSYIQHSEYFEIFKQFQSNPLAYDDGLAKKSNIHKFLQILAIIDHYYLQGKTPKESENPIEKLSKSQLLEQDGLLKQFLRPFIENSFENSPRNRFLRLEDKKIPQHFKLISMMIGAAGYANNSFFSHQFFLNPKLMKDSFIPFVQNFTDDFEYQKMFQNNEYVTALECVTCKRRTLRIDLEPQSQLEASKSFIKLGSKKCTFKDSTKNKECGGNLIVKRESIISKEPERLQNTNILAVKSYVQFSQSQYHSIQVRNLKRHHLAIGRIILHSMLMFNLAFGIQDNDILSIILVDLTFSGRQYEEYVMTALNYLMFCIIQDWEYLMTEYKLNDEKISQAIQFVLFEMMKHGQQIFIVENLRTIEGRSVFERDFSKICDKVFNSPIDFFTQTLKSTLPFEQYLFEKQHIQSNDLENLLRTVNQISIQNFERKIKEGNDKDLEFFKMLFLQKDSIKNLKHLNNLIQWTRYVFQTYSAQLTLDEVNEMKIKDILEREIITNESQKEQQKKLKKDFRKFQQAWNSFSGLIIKAKDVEVVIPEISEDSELMYCCITKDKKDLKGHLLYILLDYLQRKQKMILEEAQKLVEKTVHSIKFPAVYLLNVTKDHVVYFREKKKGNNIRNRALSQQVLNANPNDPSAADLNTFQFTESSQKQLNLSNHATKKYEEELLEEMIIKNSACNLNYSQGMSVEYDKTKIKFQTIELLLKGKHFILMEDHTQKPNFQFLNLGNLYSQFESINKIEPQVQLSEDVIKSIKEQKDVEKVHHLITQLRTTINYIESSSEEAKELKNLNLITFMKALQITKEDNILGHDLRVCHLVALYEAIEQKVEENEIKNISSKFQEDLSDQQSIVIGKAISMSDQSFQKNHLQMLITAIGRYAIRNLKNFSKDLLKKQLFEVLVDEEKNLDLFLGFIIAKKMNQKLHLTESEKEVVERSQTLRKFITEKLIPIKEEVNVSPFEIRFAKATYDRLKVQLNKLLEEEKNQNEVLARQLQDQINNEKVRNVDINEIIKEQQRQVNQNQAGRRPRRLQ